MCLLSLTEECIMPFNTGTCNQPCCEVLQPACVDCRNHADAAKPVTDCRFASSGWIKLNFNLLHFDSFKSKGADDFPHAEAHTHTSNKMPFSQNPDYAWQTSSRTKAMIRFKLEAIPCRALFGFVGFVLARYPCPPSFGWYLNLVWDVALTQRKFVLACFSKLQWQLKICPCAECSQSY